MSAWVSLDRLDDAGKVKRSKRPPGLRGVKETDRFCVQWVEPSGKVRQQRIKSQGKHAKQLADERVKVLIGELTNGTYESKIRCTWAEARKEFERLSVSAGEIATQRQYRETLDLFEAICRPKLMVSVNTAMVDKFRAELRKRRGRKRGSKMSAATINKHLRHLRAALCWANKREWLAKVPVIEMMREPEKLPVFMPPEHFGAIYAACDAATHPAGRPYEPFVWWRALMTLGIMTGMRIDEMLSLPWDDVHLDEGYLIVRAEATKGKRDDRIPLHPVAIEHLRKITDFGPLVFDWPLHGRVIYDEWHRIQAEAGIDLPCREKHEHTDSCHRYGFHALKKACGTLNATRMSKAALNKFMRHRSFSTTDKHYLNAEQIAEAATDSLFVPECLQR